MQTLTELKTNLDKQKELYIQIAELETEKGEAIAARSIKALESVTQREESIVNEIAALEDERLYTAWLYTDAHGLAADASLREIAATLDNNNSAFGEKLLEAGQGLKRAVLRVKHLNETNESLMQSNMSFFEGLLNGLKELTGLKTGYNKDGLDNSRVVRSALFNTTA